MGCGGKAEGGNWQQKLREGAGEKYREGVKVGGVWEDRERPEEGAGGEYRIRKLAAKTEGRSWERRPKKEAVRRSENGR